jgi:hypothetical protein
MESSLQKDQKTLNQKIVDGVAWSTPAKGTKSRETTFRSHFPGSEQMVKIPLLNLPNPHIRSSQK